MFLEIFYYFLISLTSAIATQSLVQRLFLPEVINTIGRIWTTVRLV